MDEFAQSRGDDDLFADDFEPVPNTNPNPVAQKATQPTAPVKGVASDKSPATAAISSNPPVGPKTRGNPSDRGRRQRGRGEGRGNGRGAGEGRGGGGNRGGKAALEGLAASRYAPEATAPTTDDTKPEIQAEAQATPTNDDPASSAAAPMKPPTEAPAISNQNESDAVTGAPEKVPQRTHAVRGDRSATGGPAHKKLTEQELTEKLEKMKIINAQKAERFRLSEADSAAFAQKEKEMAQKRAAEQKATRHQDMERAKNRQRKLQAQGGREWDSEKVESDIVDGRGRGRSSEYVRGGHGGVIRGGLAGSRYSSTAQDESNAGQPSRGRGGFEIRGRGSRGGRGGRSEPSASKPPTTEDFPSLPTPAKPPTVVSPPVVDIKSPIDKGPVDWAEEMETPVDNKKIPT